VAAVRHDQFDDGGRTWINGGTLDPPRGTNNPQQSDPVLAADRFGNFFYNSLMFGNNSGMLSYESADGGMTWAEPNFLINTFADKNWYAIDNRSSGLGAGNHYSTWQLPGQFARSTDRGRTWEIFNNNAQIYAYLEIGPEGVVHTGWWEFNGVDYRQSTNARDPNQNPTFTPPVTIPVGSLPWQIPMNPAGASGMITIETPQAGEPNEGVIYMLCSAVRRNDVTDVMFSKSTDDGRTWTTPTRVNDDPNNLDYQWMAVMSLAPGGRLDAVWFDTRDDPGHFLSRLYYSCSYDAGETWIANRPISEQFDSTLGFPVQEKIGDYFQNLSDGGGTNIIYPATFNGEQDIYFLRHHPAVLEIDPLVAGQEATFRATDAWPNRRAFLAYSLDGVGRTPVAPLNVVLDLVNPKRAGSPRMTDEAGEVEWTLPVPPAARGRVIWMQVAQLGNASNVVRQRVR